MGWTHLFLLGFARFANENEVVVVGLLAVNIGAGAVVPLLTGFTKHPNDGPVGLHAALFSARTELRLLRLGHLVPIPLFVPRSEEGEASRHYAFHNCLLF